MCFGRQLCIELLFMNLVLIKLVFNETHDHTPYSHTLSRYQLTQTDQASLTSIVLFPKLSNQHLLNYKCIVPHLLHITCEPTLSYCIPNFSDFVNSGIRHFF